MMVLAYDGVFLLSAVFLDVLYLYSMYLNVLNLPPMSTTIGVSKDIA